MKKKIGSVLLALTLLLGLCPGVWAAEEVPTTPNLTPAEVTIGGVTLRKTAEKLSADTWKVTLAVKGGGTVTKNVPIDLCLVLDCSTSMSTRTGGRGSKSTRLTDAQSAAISLVDTLVANKVNARISIAGFNENAFTMLSATSILNADGTKNTAGYNAVKGCLNNTWAEKLNYCTNVEQGLRTGLGTLSGTNAKYMILLSDGEANAYGNPATVMYYENNEIRKNLNMANAKAVTDVKATVSKLYAVGFDTDAIKDFASPGCYYTATSGTINSQFKEMTTSILQQVQNGVVVDTIDSHFVKLASADIVIAPTAVGSGAVQPSVAYDAAANKITWNLGAWLAKETPATMSYVVKLNDAQLDNAGVVTPLNTRAVFSWNALQANGTLADAEGVFPVPTVLYQKGVLRVTSTGLPAGTAGTAYNEGPFLVGHSVKIFTLTGPIEAPEDYCLQGVRINGGALEDCAAFLAAHPQGTLPVMAGETTLEYVYCKNKTVQYDANGGQFADGKTLHSTTAKVGSAYPTTDIPTRAGYCFVSWNPVVDKTRITADMPAVTTHKAVWCVDGEAKWTYNVEYYVNNTPRPEWNYSDAVLIAAPTVTSVVNHLPDLPGYEENPKLTLPVQLTQDCQTLKVYYSSLPLPDATLDVHHTYTRCSNIQEGTATTSPVVPKGTVLVSSLFITVYGGNTYTPVSAYLVRTPLIPEPDSEASSSTPDSVSLPESMCDSTCASSGTCTSSGTCSSSGTCTSSESTCSKPASSVCSNSHSNSHSEASSCEKDDSRSESRHEITQSTSEAQPAVTEVVQAYAARTISGTPETIPLALDGSFEYEDGYDYQVYIAYDRSAGCSSSASSSSASSSSKLASSSSTPSTPTLPKTSGSPIGLFAVAGMLCAGGAVMMKKKEE